MAPTEPTTDGSTGPHGTYQLPAAAPPRALKSATAAEMALAQILLDAPAPLPEPLLEHLAGYTGRCSEGPMMLLAPELLRRPELPAHLIDRCVAEGDRNRTAAPILARLPLDDHDFLTLIEAQGPNVVETLPSEPLLRDEVWQQIIRTRQPALLAQYVRAAPHGHPGRLTGLRVLQDVMADRPRRYGEPVVDVVALALHRLNRKSPEQAEEAILALDDTQLLVRMCAVHPSQASALTAPALRHLFAHAFLPTLASNQVVKKDWDAVRDVLPVMAEHLDLDELQTLHDLCVRLAVERRRRSLDAVAKKVAAWIRERPNAASQLHGTLTDALPPRQRKSAAGPLLTAATTTADRLGWDAVFQLADQLKDAQLAELCELWQVASDADIVTRAAS